MVLSCVLIVFVCLVLAMLVVRTIFLRSISLGVILLMTRAIRVRVRMIFRRTSIVFISSGVVSCRMVCPGSVLLWSSATRVRVILRRARVGCILSTIRSRMVLMMLTSLILDSWFRASMIATSRLWSSMVVHRRFRSSMIGDRWSWGSTSVVLSWFWAGRSCWLCMGSGSRSRVCVICSCWVVVCESRLCLNCWLWNIS